MRVCAGCSSFSLVPRWLGFLVQFSRHLGLGLFASHSRLLGRIYVVARRAGLPPLRYTISVQKPELPRVPA